MRIFISYSSKDRDVVKELAAEIESLVDGVEVWFDQAEGGLIGGQNWWDEICAQIRTCDIFLSAISPHEMSSEPCRRERLYADLLKKPLLPVQIADLDFRDLDTGLQRTHVLDYRQASRDQRAALRRAIQNMPPAPALPPDAIERQPDAPLDPIGVLRDRIRTLNTDPSVQRSLITDINALEYQDSYRMHIPDLVARLRNRREILVGASQDLLNKLFGADPAASSKAIPTESTAATLAASSELRMLYDRASEHEVRNEKDMARQLFHQLIDLDAAPNQLWKAIGQGRLNFLDGDYNGARRIFEQIVTQAPSFWLGWYNRGRTRAMQNDYEGAISDCTETLRLEASYAPAYVTRGFARKAMGDDGGALSDYNEAIQLNPNLALAYNNRGLARAEQGDHDAAISDYNEAIRLAPKLALAYNNRGLARYHKSDHEGALSDYNQAIRLDAKLALAYSNRGIIFEGRQQHQAAASDYQRALELSSMNDPNYLNIYVLKREYIKKYLG